MIQERFPQAQEHQAIRRQGAPQTHGLTVGCMLKALTTGLIVAAMLAPATAEPQPSFKHLDPKTGFRLGHYRAPTPESVPGARRIDLTELQDLLEKPNVALVDVMAHTGAGPDPKSGEWRLSEARFNIPGSIWLPEVGLGRLTPVLRRYFRENLEAITAGDKTHTIVIYCIADCWPSWNAAKRAGELGYENVLWYSEGTDGWSQSGLPLQKARPVPIELE